MSTPLSPEESRELIKLCQSGRLYTIRDWILAGKSLQTAPETKKTVLSVAIKTGFHSLVELIAPHETQEAKNQGLADAVRQKRLDLVELLVACGAEIKAVPFTDVLLGWEPRIIQFFIDNGSDVIKKSEQPCDYSLNASSDIQNLQILCRNRQTGRCASSPMMAT